MSHYHVNQNVLFPFFVNLCENINLKYTHTKKHVFLKENAPKKGKWWVKKTVFAPQTKILGFQYIQFTNRCKYGGRGKPNTRNQYPNPNFGINTRTRTRKLFFFNSRTRTRKKPFSNTRTVFTSFPLPISLHRFLWIHFKKTSFSKQEICIVFFNACELFVLLPRVIKMYFREVRQNSWKWLFWRMWDAY